MKLKQYIEKNSDYRANINEIWPIILKECKQILKVYKSAVSKSYKSYSGLVFFRGMKWKGPVAELTPRQDRKPKDSDMETHVFADDIFKKKFGWKPRSEGVFVSSSRDMSHTYGDLYVFFPVDGFKFVWSENISDFWKHIPSVRKRSIMLRWESGNYDLTDEFKEFYSKEVKISKDLIEMSYIDTDLFAALKTSNEVMFKCKKYYCLTCNMFENYEHIIKLIGKK